jgi:hypothetical protein
MSSGKRKRADRRVLRAMAAIPTAALEMWLRRHFETVVPLARAELRRRNLRAASGR